MARVRRQASTRTTRELDAARARRRERRRAARAMPTAAPPMARGALALAPLAVPGFALYALPYFIPRMIARTSDPDAVSTVKLGAALVVYPVWMGGLVGAVVRCCRRRSRSRAAAVVDRLAVRRAALARRVLERTPTRATADEQSPGSLGCGSPRAPRSTRRAADWRPLRSGRPRRSRCRSGRSDRRRGRAWPCDPRGT